MRGIIQFKARAEIQGVPIPYIVEDTGHPGGPSSLYIRGYRTSRGFFKFFQVFVRKSMGLGYFGPGHSHDKHF